MFICITIDESCLDSNGRLLQNGTSFIAHQEEAAPVTTSLNPKNNPPAPTSSKDSQAPANSSITNVVDLLSKNDDHDEDMTTMLSDTKCMDCSKRHYTTKRCRKILKHRALPYSTSYHRMTVATRSTMIKHNENESGPPSTTPPPPHLPALKKGRTTTNSIEKNEKQQQNDVLNYHIRRPHGPLHRFFDTEVVPESRTFVVRVVSAECSTFEVSRNSNDVHDVLYFHDLFPVSSSFSFFFLLVVVFPCCCFFSS
jgi:hypothetical protein